jgi:hypothetical protein
MTEVETEIRRLVELMPASGRMLTKIVYRPKQSQVIASQFPKPWQRGDRLIEINFNLWSELSQGQRDLLLLSEVGRLINIRWFKPDLYQGLTLAGALGVGLQLWQRDPVGIAVAGSLTTLAARQIWQNYQSQERAIEADNSALKVAVRRGYEHLQAVQYLLSAIESVARLENRSSLSYGDLMRCQNLKIMLQSQAYSPSRVGG